MVSQPAAFMSYARFDDEHEDGLISQFRERLSAEMRVQTGREFPIFQDRADIAWGQNWRQRINESLDEVTLLLVILTPSFFRSAACRAEVQRFLERERNLGRQDLILPVYYVSTPELNDPAQRAADDLAQTLAGRQYADWRELRFEPLTSALVRRAIAQLAERMRNPFWYSAAALPATRNPAAAPRAARPEADSPGQPTLTRPSAKPEPPTHVVDQYQRGDFATIAEAIASAQPGDRILVRPGLYRDSLVVDKPLEIIGDGPVADIEIQVRDAHAVQFRASIGRIANLTIRQAGDGPGYAMEISQGRLEVEGCDISSRTRSCVIICGGADPRLRRNTIHDGADFGVTVDGQSLGTLEDNDIFGHENAGVAILNGSDPTLRRNVIHDNRKGGVIVDKQSRGILEYNEITRNEYAGVEIWSGSDPMLRRNTIYGNKAFGVHLRGQGRGTLQDNDIFGHDVGVGVDGGARPAVRDNRINRNHWAVALYSDGRGVFEDNDLTANQHGAWFVDEGTKVNSTRGRNRE